MIKYPEMKGKPIIYQVLPRIWGNSNESPVRRGSLKQNGTGKFSDIDGPALEYFKWLGCTHIWFTGVIRHSTKEQSDGCIPSNPQFVKGEAGSPYAVCDYFDVNPYLADDPENRMKEFHDLVRRTHDAGLKVIIDFVPNHVARDYGNGSPVSDSLGAGDDVSVHWSADNDFFYYPGQELNLPNGDDFRSECASLRSGDFDREYRILPSWVVDECRKSQSPDPSVEKFLTPYSEFPAKATGNAYTPSPGINDWYETVKINYCDWHTGTWDKMLEILRFWVSKGVDGFRCDMVELVPPEFFTWAISEIRKSRPDIIFIAEVYQKSLYKKYIREVGFDFLYDKSGLYDTLRTVVEANSDGSLLPLELWQSAKGITRNWQFLGDLQPYMLNFLENHDEQRFASEFFGHDACSCFAPLAVSLMLNRAPFMIYFGQETGERGMDDEGFSNVNGRTSIFDWWSVESVRDLRSIIAEGLYRDTDSPWPEKLEKYRKFFARFSSFVRFASSNPAVRDGVMYDLCYCNTSSEGFDIDRHYAFLRDQDDETVLVAANFSGVPAKMHIGIPSHAFEWLGLDVTPELNPDTPVVVSVPAHDAVIVTLSSGQAQ